MFYEIFFSTCLVLFKLINCVDYSNSWNYINLHCRDNENVPVDWWYMYKPPVDVIPFLVLGRNFTFMTPDSMGQWEHSNRPITKSMLQNTLSPVYRPTYLDHLAVVSYENYNRNDNDEYATMGVLMADEKGGVWIAHTVPGLLDVNNDHHTFPESEHKNGHLISCLSLDLITLNQVALTIRQMSPRYTFTRIPPDLKTYLPAWNFLDGNKWTGYQALAGIEPRDTLDFLTRNETIRATLLLRQPGSPDCLYEKFASKRKVVLDIYRHKELKKPICRESYSLRHIESISIQNPEFVHYIDKANDRSGFGVTAAAHWQRLGGGGGGNFWACTSSLDDRAKGGLLLCIEDYLTWRGFDQFKVKEPEC